MHVVKNAYCDKLDYKRMLNSLLYYNRYLQYYTYKYALTASSLCVRLSGSIHHQYEAL